MTDRIGNSFFFYCEVSRVGILLGTNISFSQGMFEGEFPFPKVGYVSSLEGKPLGNPLLNGLQYTKAQFIEMPRIHILFEGLGEHFPQKNRCFFPTFWVDPTNIVFLTENSSTSISYQPVGW